MYAFNNTRFNAKRRGHEFTLTFEQFKEFCIDTSYIELKGRYKNNMSIDRKEADKGYIYGNLQILTVSDNVKKRFTDAILNSELEEMGLPF